MLKESDNSFSRKINILYCSLRILIKKINITFEGLIRGGLGGLIDV